MILAAWRDGTYDLFLYLHILSALVAFAPTIRGVVRPSPTRSEGEVHAADINETRMFSLGGLGAILVTGIVMIILSDEAIEFSETWISLSFLVWIAIGGVLSALVLKGQRMLAAGDGEGRRRVVLGNQVTTVLVLIALYLMIFKPGSVLP